MPTTLRNTLVSSGILLLARLLPACGPAAVTPGTPSSSAQSVAVVCLTPGDAAPDGALLCGRPAVLECGEPLTRVFVEPSATPECGSAVLVASPTRLALGANTVVVRDESGIPGRAVCSSEVTVVDRRAPEVTARTLALWPPNHRMETLRPADCVAVRDACDEAPRAYFTWAQVDEPDDATGDGNTSADVQFDGCGAVSVRAERRGNGDGRVYSLGVRVVDRSGNAADAVCQVVVAHHRSGRRAVADAPARRVLPPADCR
jgi:hypothetical protein